MAKIVIFFFIFLLLFSSSFAFSLSNFIAKVKTFVLNIVKIVIHLIFSDVKDESPKPIETPEIKNDAPQAINNSVSPTAASPSSSSSLTVVSFFAEDEPKISEIAVCNEASCDKLKLSPPQISEEFYLRFKVSGIHGNTKVTVNTSEGIFEKTFNQENSFILPLKLNFAFSGLKIITAHLVDLTNNKELSAELARFSIYETKRSLITENLPDEVFNPEPGKKLELQIIIEALIRNFIPGVKEGLKSLLDPKTVFSIVLMVAAIALLSHVGIFAAALGILGSGITDFMVYIPLINKMFEKARKNENIDEEAKEFWKQFTPDAIALGAGALTAYISQLNLTRKLNLIMSKHFDELLNLDDELTENEFRKTAENIFYNIKDEITVFLKDMDIESPTIKWDSRLNGEYGNYNPDTDEISFDIKRYISDLSEIWFASSLSKNERIEKLTNQYSMIYETINHEFLHYLSFNYAKIDGEKKNIEQVDDIVSEKLGDKIIKYSNSDNPAIRNEFFDLIAHKLAMTKEFFDSKLYFNGWSTRVKPLIKEAVKKGDADYILAFTAESEVVLENADISINDKEELADLIKLAKEEITKLSLNDDYEEILAAYKDIFKKTSWS